MVQILDIQQACKKFAELEFFNSHYMSVAAHDTINKKEIMVYLFKNIRTDNLPQDFEGFKVIYNYAGK